jgi:signal transduction histidine kinase
MDSVAFAPRKQLRLSIAGGVHAPERARAWLCTAASWLPRELERTLLLLASELVNNSVVHGCADEDHVIEIELGATSNGVRAQVSDNGPGFAPKGRQRAMDEPGGWGLVLVETLSERWGVERGECTSVWFELRAPAA